MKIQEHLKHDCSLWNFEWSSSVPIPGGTIYIPRIPLLPFPKMREDPPASHKKEEWVETKKKSIPVLFDPKINTVIECKHIK